MSSERFICIPSPSSCLAAFKELIKWTFGFGHSLSFHLVIRNFLASWQWEKSLVNYHYPHHKELWTSDWFLTQWACAKCRSSVSPKTKTPCGRFWKSNKRWSVHWCEWAEHTPFPMCPETKAFLCNCWKRFILSQYKFTRPNKTM